MKILVFASALLSLSPTNLWAEDDLGMVMWRSLSAKAQNLHYALHSIPEGGAPDPSMHEVALKEIDDALNELVVAGALLSKQIELTHPPMKDAKDWKPIFEVIHGLSEKYGYYVASEMCDMGGKLVFQVFHPGDTIKLHLRLPQKEMDRFLAAAKPLMIQAK